MIKPTLDQAYMGLDLIANNGQYTFGQVWDGLVDISYMGAETKLQIIQGDFLGAEYGFGAASTAMGVGLGLGATGTPGKWGLGYGLSSKPFTGKLTSGATEISNHIPDDLRADLDRGGSFLM